MPLKVQTISEGEFRTLGSAWDLLLSGSRADRLFMSWPWLYSWWEIWSSAYNLELALVAVYTEQGELLGIAPLYFHNLDVVFGLTLRRLQFIGNAWRIGPSVRTEYVGIIAKAGRETEVYRAVSSYLATQDWDELIIADSAEGQHLEFGEHLRRELDTSEFERSQATGICLSTEGSFKGWLNSLGRNFRLKVFNRRAFFESELSGSSKFVASEIKAYEQFFQGLNRLHEIRWGRPCFDKKAVEFHLKLLSRLSGQQEPLMSTLTVNKEHVSFLYDIRAGSKVYNLQAGYCEGFHKKISMGTLHLGYSIEAAFSDSKVEKYDLLAGSGKNTFYKSHFKGDRVNFKTLTFVRAPYLKWVYKYQSWLPKGFKSRINRILGL